ncbi:MAG: hypothetical protein JW732_05690 [Dehalococcoidia bacterium]|nr:hypothetical protein [Dehalococcoidia bacterium]
MGTVISHMEARVPAVVQKNRPYEMRNIQRKAINCEVTKKLILSNYQVPEDVRQERRQCKRGKGDTIKPRRKGQEMSDRRTNEAVTFPQAVVATTLSRCKV